jgi:uncharacterized membrane protein
MTGNRKKAFVTMGVAFLVPVVTAVFGACSGSDDSPSGGSGGSGSIVEPVECNVTAPTACADPAPTFADVKPIFSERCVTCHNGEPGGPWPLTEYEHVADWAQEIRGQVLACTMPPADAGSTITTEEREKILAWIRCGALE